MKFFFDSSRAYLVCLYFSLSFFYLSFVLGEEDPVPLLGYILALIIFIVISHDFLLRFISNARGEPRQDMGVIDVPFLLDLSHSIHDANGLTGLRQQLSAVFSEIFGTRKMLWLLSSDLHPDMRDNLEAAGLYAWPVGEDGNVNDGEFEAFLANQKGPVFAGEAPSMVEKVFSRTGTNMLLPMADAGRMVCVILLERKDARMPCTLQQLQALDFLVMQLGNKFGRIPSAQFNA